MENKVLVEVYYSGKNFSAHAPILPGCISTGKTPEEMKQNIKDAIEFHLEGCREDDDKYPTVFDTDYTLDYKFDAEGLLQYYKGIFTNAALERITGINQRQLQHYSTGLHKPRPQQIKKIETGLHQLGKELISLHL